MKFLLLFIFFSCLLSCASNKTSEVVRNESVELNLSYETDSLNQQTILGIPLADRVIDFSVKTIGSVLEKEAAKYKASYFASKVGKDFYETKVINGKENRSLKYNTLEIVRKAGIPQEKVANIQFKFEFDESGYFFRLRPHYIKIDKTKAKRNLKDETIDLIIDVTLFGYWVINGLEYHSEAVSESSFNIRNIKVGEILNDPNILREYTSDWLVSAPISSNKIGELVGNGNYKFEVIISEVDDFGEKVEKASIHFKDNETKIIELLKNKQ